MRRAALAVLVVMALALGGAFLRARSQRARMWSAVEQMCACGRPALAQMSELRATATGGLDRVLTAQAHALMGDCEAMRVAADRRGLVGALRGSALRVEPTEGQRRATRDMVHALGLMCGDEHRAFWEALRARLAEGAPAGDAGAEVLRAAREHLRVRDAMCEGARRLSAPPGRYALTLDEAERAAARCGR